MSDAVAAGAAGSDRSSDDDLAGAFFFSTLHDPEPLTMPHTRIANRRHRLPSRRLGGVAALVLAPAFLVAEDAASDAWTRGLVAAWFPALGGAVSADDALVEGDDFEAEDFDLDDRQVAFMAEGVISLPLFLDIGGGVFSYGVDGQDTFTTPRFFDGQAFVGEVETDITITDAYLEAAWRPISTDLASLSLGLAIHLVDTSVEISSTSQQETVDESFPIPAVAVRGLVEPYAGWSIEGRLHAMSVEIGDVDATYYDLLAHVGYRPIDWIGIVAGYRFVSYDFDVDLGGDDEVHADISLDGPFLGAAFYF